MVGSVLLVEDEENLASLVKAYLEQEGYRVTATGSGAEALRILEEEQVRLVLGDIVLERRSREVSVAGEPVELRPKEFDLLAYLMQNRGIVLSRDLLLERVWGLDFAGGTRTVDVHVAQLRRKLDRPELIRTIRGSGYKAVQP